MSFNFNHFRFWVNRRIIQSPRLADWVYRGAYHFNWLAALTRDTRAKLFPVPLAEIQNFSKQLLGGQLLIGTTNICNARCTFCAYPRAVDNKTLKTGVMPMATFQKVITERVRDGGASVDLTPVVGDPLIDPGLLDKIKFARQAGIREVCFTTNGILLLHQDMYKHVVDSGVAAMYISIGATDETNYREVYGVNQYAKVINGLHKLLEYNRQQGEPVYINFRFRNAQRPSEILTSDDFIRFIKPYLSKKVEVNFTVDFDNWGGVIRQEELPGHMRLRKPRPEVKIPCFSLFSYAVRFDGSVRLCGCRMQATDMDDLVVGNINHQTMKEIADSEAARKIISGFYSGNRPETCKKCTMYTPITRSWLAQRNAASATAAASAPAATPAPTVAPQPAPAESPLVNK